MRRPKLQHLDSICTAKLIRIKPAEQTDPEAKSDNAKTTSKTKHMKTFFTCLRWVILLGFVTRLQAASTNDYTRLTPQQQQALLAQHEAEARAALDHVVIARKQYSLSLTNSHKAVLAAHKKVTRAGGADRGQSVAVQITVSLSQLKGTSQQAMSSAKSFQGVCNTAASACDFMANLPFQSNANKTYWRQQATNARNTGQAAVALAQAYADFINSLRVNQSVKNVSFGNLGPINGTIVP